MNIFKINKLNIDYWQSNTEEKDKTVIILIGLPGKPKEYEIISRLNNSGFNVMLPHYEGSWNSEGKFLEQQPSKFIDELISDNQLKDVYILGSSFGGWVGLGLKDNEKIKKVCVTSPVISFKKVPGIETLAGYLREAFPDDYRFDEEGWQNLINDNLQDPELPLKLNPNKVMIMTGSEDDQINYTDIQEYSQKNHIQKLLIEDCGHITPSKFTVGQINKIMTFFS